MERERWKMHLSVAVAVIAAMTLALSPAMADPVPDTDEYPDVAFLARNDVPFDAQTAASMAAQLGAPMFITPPDALSDAASGGIADLNPEVIIVAGGVFAVSDDVADAAAEQCEPDCTVDRRFGAGRDATAAALAEIAADYGFDRPVLQGSNHVAGDVHVGGTVSTNALTVEDTGLVSGLNADRLDGMHASDFLGATEKAADSELLDGKDSSEFLGKTEKAADADTVDGIDSPALQLPASVPPGRTMRGGYNLRVDSDGDGTWGIEIAFPFPLGSAPTDVIFVPGGGTPPAECTGDASSPEADPGYVCVYESSGDGYGSVSGIFATRYEVEIQLGDDGSTGGLGSFGSWAYTEPTMSTASTTTQSSADEGPRH